MILSWVCVYNLYFRENVAYFETATGALYLVSSLLAASTWRKKNPDPSELISFECPFCEKEVKFDIVDRDKSQSCPECSEIIIVTEDPEVHKATKKAYDEILAAMDSEDLQEDQENLKDPSLAPSVLGFQFDLVKEKDTEVQNADKEKESIP